MPSHQDQESDTEKCIQNLEDHLVATQTDENPEGQQSTREDVLQDSDSENQGVEEVGSSGSSQEEITVNPSNFDLTGQTSGPPPKGPSNPGDPSREFVKGFQVLHVRNTRKPRTPNPKSDSKELPDNPPDKSVAENAGKTEKTENEEVMEARAKPHKEHLKASEPQPMTQSCVVEVQNTGPLITDMDLQSNEPNTGGRGGKDDVEGIIDPLNKTKIDDQQKPDLTNISEV